jgi:hypothetical protein
MVFNKLFSVVIEHEYFQDKKCYGLSLEATKESLVTLKSNGILLNFTGHCTVNFFRSGIEGVPFDNKEIANVSFSFLVYLRDAFFEYYSDVPKMKDGVVMHFINPYNPDLNEQVLDQISIEVPKNASRYRKLVGIVTITLGENIPKQFTIRIKAASTKLMYYVLVNDNKRNFKIDGTDAGIEFEELEAASDQIAKDIGEVFPGDAVLLFRSVSVVEYREKDKKNIRLINSESNTVVRNYLPVPTPKENGIKIINTKV